MKKILFLLSFLALAAQMQAQFTSAPAFPGAEGFGRYTTGGRGGKVYHVTNLNDSGTGSLREAVKATGKRIVVFDVAGIIELKSALKIQNDDITILGQTAPGDGICLKNYTFGIFANNVIIRYIRCRMGNEIKLADGTTAVEDDAMNAYQKDGSNKHNIIIDHCSMSWSVDECGSFYGNKDFTLQWCILAESLVNGGHTKGAHGYGGIWGGESAAFHHNLIAHHDSRNPRFDHGYVSTLAGPLDYINNVVYNWGGNSTYGGENKPGYEAKKFNMINNYYKPGPYTKTISGRSTRLLNPTTKCSNCNKDDQYDIVPGKFFMSGNIVNGSVASVSTTNIAFDSGYDLTKFKANCVLTTRAMSNDADFKQYSTISLQKAETAYDKILLYAGASLKRDRVDADVCDDVKNGGAKYRGSVSGKAGLIDDPQDVGGWPSYAGTAKLDTDNDGIPDEWETENGLNPNDASDALTYSLDPKGYYINLEVYANSLVEGIVKAERAGAETTFEEYYPVIKTPIVVPGEEDTPSSGPIFSMTPSVTETATLANGETIDGSLFATVTGGKVMYQNNNTTAYKAVQNSQFYIGTTSCYFKIDLDTPLRTGDVIKFPSMPASSNGSSGVYIGKTADDKSNATTTDVFTNVTFVVPSSLNGASAIYITRIQGKGTYFSNMTIYRGTEGGGNDEDIEVPTDTVIAEPVALSSNGWYMVEAGNAAQLLGAIKAANSSNAAQKFIFLPNGTYELGCTTGTIISGSNISIIGESTEGVIIRNAPDKKNEGLTKADLFLNNSTGLYLQDLTLQNALDYYAAGAAGRAACLQDKGKNTIAKNVRLLSHQDTYYPHRDGAYFYWEGGEIHGTVDYICGGGNVYFNGITLVNESRTATGKTGDCTMTAAYTASTDKGYVFEGCHVKSNCSTFNFGRSWKDAKTVFLNTVIESGKLADSRWTLAGMNSVAVGYYEYNTVDKSGNGKNTPSSYKAKFTHTDKTTGTVTENEYETILTAEGAKAYSYDNFFASASWDPKSIASQANVNGIEASATYLVEEDGKFVSVIKGSELDKSAFTSKTTLRKANSRGGFGTAVPAATPTAINGVETSTSSKGYNFAGIPVGNTFRGIVIKDRKKIVQR